MMKTVIAIMIGMLVTGCSIRSKGYYLLDGAQNVSAHTHLKYSVGIENITLPRYFNQASVAIKEGKNRVSFRANASWVSNMNEHLTTVLISYLKHYFHTSDIYLYPWDVSRGVDKKVRVTLENFIYHDKQIILDASWEIVDQKGEKMAKFFHIKVPSSSETKDIVAHMDEAFSALEMAIAKSLYTKDRLVSS